MTVANTQLIPEFQYYFNRFVKTSIVNKYQIPMPVEVDESFIPEGTVVELLCNENYSHDDYTYWYKNESRSQCWPTLTRQRLMIYPGPQYMVPANEGDAGAVNLFNLQHDDLMMLDALLAYRHDSTSVVIVDTTAVIDTTAGFVVIDTVIDSTADFVVTDATTGITYVYATLDSLDTPLSKEIYLYLQFKIYQNYELYDTDTIISDCSLLATCFELKLIDDYFQFMTDRSVSFNIDCDDG